MKNYSSKSSPCTIGSSVKLAPYRAKMHNPDYSFRHLKATVTIGRILSAYRLDAKLTRRGEQLYGPCPLHGGDNPTAFRVHLAKGLWRCFTTCGGGDTVELIRRIEHCSYGQAARHLRRLAADQSPVAPLDIPLSHQGSRTPPFVPFANSIPLNPRIPFLQHIKGVTVATATQFEAGTTTRSAFLRNTVAVRLHDMSGRPLGYCGRNLHPPSPSQPGKWRFPKNFPKTQILYNAHRAEPFRKCAVIIVECPWAAMRLTQAGFPNTVALLGTTISDTQIAWLTRSPSILLLLDGDLAGQNAAPHIARCLAPFTKVLTHRLSHGKEPEDLSDQDLVSLVRTYSSFF
jgi:DNA primase